MDRRLTRSRDAMVGGVAAGLANWLRADPALIRIAWALLVPLTGGAALVAYIVAWIVVPEEPRHPAVVSAAPPQESTDATGATAGEVVPADASTDSNRPGDRTAFYIGGGLVLIGLWFLVREYMPEIRWDLIWPLLLVGAGVLIVVSATRRR